jgi:hypothetical protein
MNDRKRTVWIGALVALASVSLAQVGLPYRPLEVLASELQQYGPTNTPIVPCVEVGDQDAGGGSVVASRVCATRRGWVVIYRDEGGAPGGSIGMSLVQIGVTTDVAIDIDLEQATPQLFAQLHQDLGEPQVFDGADTVEAGPVAFNVSLPGQPPPTAASQPTATVPPTATTAAIPTGTPEPSGVPALPATIVLLGLCLALLTGLALLAVAFLPMLRRRSRRVDDAQREAEDD